MNSVFQIYRPLKTMNSAGKSYAKKTFSANEEIYHFCLPTLTSHSI